MEVDFLGYLAVKAAFARASRLVDEAETCDRAAETFRNYHLMRWLPGFCERLSEVAPDGYYPGAIEFAATVAKTWAG